MKNNAKIIIFYIALIFCILIAASTLLSQPSSEKLTYSDVVDMFNNQQVSSFVITESNDLILEATDGKQYTIKLRSLEIFERDLKQTILEQQKQGIITDYHYVEPTEIPWWVSFLPYVVIIVLFIVLWIYVMNQAAGGKGSKINSFGRSRAKLASSEKNKVTFDDVAGADEEKEELMEVVEFLKNSKRYIDLGAKIPRGVLLVGPPGTGKTLLAKAVAGEANVPFYSISGSDFVEMYVGVGASRVRDLFDTAKKNSHAIIFIDEIDAVGRHRGAGFGGGHDEREQTLNQLLVEMDGFGKHDGIIVIAATNRPDILDPALLRPGRFDRQVTINYPDLKGRTDILKVHAKGKPFEDSVDLEKVAQATVGFTGADLANLLNEAALLAARKHKYLIGMKDIEEASLKIMVGTQKKSHRFKPEEKKKTAYHEAGHAVLAHLLPSVDPVRQISIIPSGRALGYTLTVPLEDKFSVYKKGLKEEITMILGGRVAEKVFFDDISGGASNDIQRATQIARNMVTRYGMSDELGPIAFASERSNDEIFLGRDFNNTKNYSEETAFKIDEEIKKIIDSAYTDAERIILENKEKLITTADYLILHETMDEEQFKFLMDTNPTPSIEEIAQIALDKQECSDKQNQTKAEEKAKEQNQDNNCDDKSNDSDDSANESGLSKKFSVKPKNESNTASSDGVDDTQNR